jgi:hypothetical protein
LSLQTSLYPFRRGLIVGRRVYVNKNPGRKPAAGDVTPGDNLASRAVEEPARFVYVEHQTGADLRKRPPPVDGAERLNRAMSILRSRDLSLGFERASRQIAEESGCNEGKITTHEEIEFRACVPKAGENPT